MDVVQVGTEVGEEVIPQAYPLYVTILDGETVEKWLVIAWCPIGNTTDAFQLDTLWPMVVPIGSGAHHQASALRPYVDAQTLWTTE